MREIKFRGLTANNEFVYGDLRYDYPGSTAYFDEYPHRICWYLENGGSANAPVKKGTVGQFTGLRDSKRTAEYPEGQEIYEGDILQIQTGDGNKWRVLFDDGSFVLEKIMTRKYRSNKKHTQDFCCGDDIELYQLEVIGNIHDNPTLLGGQPE